MKKQLIHFIPISVMICVFQTSCLKMQPPAETTDFDWQPWLISMPDNKTLLQNKNWKLTEGSITPAFNGTTDWFNAYDSCTKDDLYFFGGSNSFILNEGFTKCDPLSPQDISGYWKYNAIPEYVQIKLPLADTIKLFITSIDDSTFNASSSDLIAGVSYTRTWLFKRQ